MLEPPQALRRGLFRGKRHYQDRAAVLPAAIMGELRALPECLQHISRTLCHGCSAVCPDGATKFTRRQLPLAASAARGRGAREAPPERAAIRRACTVWRAPERR